MCALAVADDVADDVADGVADDVPGVVPEVEAVVVPAGSAGAVEPESVWPAVAGTVPQLAGSALFRWWGRVAVAGRVWPAGVFAAVAAAGGAGVAAGGFCAGGAVP